MVILLVLLVAIVVGGLVGTLIVKDGGYVLISYGDIVVETSLWIALAGVVIVYLLWRLALLVMRSVTRSQGKVLRWRSSRKVRRARNNTVRGLLLMAEGRWNEARKLLLQDIDYVDTPLINYLNAARAAHELDEAEARDQYLAKAHESTPGAKFAALLTQAEFQINDGDYEQALATLINLRKHAPKHKTVSLMLVTCYEALGDWQALHQHLPSLAERKAVNDSELQRLSRLVWRSMLGSETDVAKLWKKMPANVRGDTPLLLEWIESLHSRQLDNEAEHALRLILEHTWDAQLLAMYGQVFASDPKRQLLVAQGWSKARPSDADLAVVMGRLCLKTEQFEQAREYFETALRLRAEPEVYAELGRLCIALGDERRGADYLLKSVASLPDLPMPAAPLIRQTQTV